MTGLDYTVVAIVLLSALLGWWRGLVYEVLSILGWMAAWVVARLFTSAVMPYMPAFLGSESAKTVAAFVSLFIATLALGGIVAWIFSKLVKWVGLGWLDGLLGTLFGMLRGALVVLVLAVFAGMTSFPKEPFWRNSWSGRHLESMALTSRAWLPESVAQRVHF